MHRQYAGRVTGSLTGVRALLDSALDVALDAAFPGLCVGCGREGTVLCTACVRPLDARLGIAAGVHIGLPGDIPEPLLQLEWCAAFRGVVREALHGLKYHGEQRLAAPLGNAVARRWRTVGVGADLVTHVPVHADRARQRGYDQAALIARAAAGQLGLPHATLLRRQRATIAQFDLDRRHRAANVEGAFGRVRGSVDVAGRWILLVDDVVTTGATLAACAIELEAGGAAGVSAITVARER